MVAAAVKARAAVGTVAGWRWLRRILGALALVVSCTALAVGGLWLGLRLSTPGTYSSALGTASFQVQPAAHGSVEVFIPLPTGACGRTRSAHP